MASLPQINCKIPSVACFIETPVILLHCEHTCKNMGLSALQQELLFLSLLPHGFSSQIRNTSCTQEVKF